MDRFESAITREYGPHFIFKGAIVPDSPQPTEPGINSLRARVERTEIGTDSRERFTYSCGMCRIKGQQMEMSEVAEHVQSEHPEIEASELFSAMTKARIAARAATS